MNEAGKPLHGGIYCRLSLAIMGDTTKVDDQEQICRRILPADVAVSPDHVFKDNSKSAWQRNRKRPAWDAMLAAVERGELDVIVVYHGDRLVRQPRDLEDLLDIAENKGVRLLSPTGQYNLDDPDHQMMLRWTAGRAKNEVDHISRRMKNGHRRRREQGIVRSGGRGGRAFGFQTNDMDQVPEEAEMIRDAARRILAGEPTSAIVREWNAQGLVTVTGGPWSHGTVKKMLLRPRCAGLMPDGESTAAWEPILDRETWEAVRAVLLNKPIGFTPTNAAVHLLSGIAECGPCRETVAIRHNTRGRQLLGYGCINRECKRRVHRAQPYLDAYVIGHVLKVLNDPGMLSDISAPDNPGLAGEIAALEARKAEAESQLRSLVDHPNLRPDLLVASLASFDERIEELRGQIAMSARHRLLLEHAGLDEAAFERLPLHTRRSLVSATYRVVIWPVAKKGPGFETDTIELLPIGDEA